MTIKYKPFKQHSLDYILKKYIVYAETKKGIVLQDKKTKKCILVTGDKQGNSIAIPFDPNKTA